jgi:hypothetical protein
MVTLCTTWLNIKKFYVTPIERIKVFCIDIRKSSDFLSVQNLATGFYDQDVVCLLRGTSWM